MTNKTKKKEKITRNQKEKLLSVIDGRMYLVGSELKRVADLLLQDLESTKKFIKNL